MSKGGSRRRLENTFRPSPRDTNALKVKTQHEVEQMTKQAEVLAVVVSRVSKLR